ncbi:MAG: hypothetical protein Q4A71_00280 [Actinomycetaceae bacterium]|nr:hypothetical protein [Actinomycetaceae bacterium]
MNELPPRQIRRQGRRKAQLPWHKKILRYWPVFVGVVISVLILGTIFSFGPKGPQTEPGKILVSGNLGALPIVEFAAPLEIKKPVVWQGIPGSGRLVAVGDPVLLKLTVFDGDTGKNESPEGKPQIVLSRASNEDLSKEMSAAIVGRREGTRLVLARPVSKENTPKMEVDVLDILPTAVHGLIEQPSDAPVKVDTVDELPELAAITGQVPHSPYVGVMIQGKGAQINNERKVVVQYGIWRWKDKTKIAYTWKKDGPQLIDLEKTFPGVRTLVTDQHLGSRLLMVIPADEARGADDLVVVADLLAVPN